MFFLFPSLAGLKVFILNQTLLLQQEHFFPLGSNCLEKVLLLKKHSLPYSKLAVETPVSWPHIQIVSVVEIAVGWLAFLKALSIVLGASSLLWLLCVSTHLGTISCVIDSCTFGCSYTLEDDWSHMLLPRQLRFVENRAEVALLLALEIITFYF